MDILKETKRIGKVVLEKGMELGEEAKTRIDIAVLESKINDQKKKIGKIVYEEKIDTKNEGIKKAVEKIDALMEDIESKKKEKENN